MSILSSCIFGYLCYSSYRISTKKTFEGGGNMTKSEELSKILDEIVTKAKKQGVERDDIAQETIELIAKGCQIPVEEVHTHLDQKWNLK